MRVQASVIFCAFMIGCGAAPPNPPPKPTSSAPTSGAMVGLPTVDPVDPAAPVTLASKQRPQWLIANESAVFWFNRPEGQGGGDYTLVRCAKEGCGGAPTVTAAHLHPPFGLQSANGNLYWADQWDRTLLACSTAGCGSTPRVIIPSQLWTPAWFVVDREWVYWTASGDRNEESTMIVQSPSSGFNDASRVLVSGQEPIGYLQHREGLLFWTYLGACDRNLVCQPFSGSVMRLLHDATTAEMLLPAQNQPRSITMVGDTHYWIDEGTPATKNDGMVMACPAYACLGNERVIASGQRAPDNIAIDGKHVYWSNAGDATLVRCPTSGCAGAPQIIYKGAITSFGLDETYLFVATLEGSGFGDTGSILRFTKSGLGQ